MFGWFRARSLEEVLNPTQVIRVHGVRFRIRKLSPMDYLAGSKAIRQVFDTAMKADSVASVEIQRAHQGEIDSHFIDTFVAAVIEPKMKRGERGPADEAGTPAANLLTDWDLANELYRAIIDFSYGKKKVETILSKTGASKPI